MCHQAAINAYDGVSKKHIAVAVRVAWCRPDAAVFERKGCLPAGEACNTRQSI